MNSSAHLRKNNRTALTELQLAEDRLEEEIGDLRHELRRVRDGIERASDLPWVLEQKARQLLSSIELCERDLKENRNQRENVLQQLNSLPDYEIQDK